MKTLIHHGLFLLVALVVIPVQAHGAYIFSGQFYVVSADPWELELRDSSGNPITWFSEETGLPHVRAEHFHCWHREILPADVGKTFECSGNLPTAGGAVVFRNDDENLLFSSKWENPNDLVSQIHTDMRAKLLKMGSIALGAFAVIAFGSVILVRKKRRQSSSGKAH